MMNPDSNVSLESLSLSSTTPTMTDANFAPKYCLDGAIFCTTPDKASVPVELTSEDERFAREVTARPSPSQTPLQARNMQPPSHQFTFSIPLSDYPHQTEGYYLLLLDMPLRKRFCLTISCVPPGKGKWKDREREIIAADPGRSGLTFPAGCRWLWYRRALLSYASGC
jgi:hypothetical protein